VIPRGWNVLHGGRRMYPDEGVIDVEKEGDIPIERENLHG
jgi:hypothetical protein